MLRGTDGRDYCFEVHVRFRQIDDWAIDVFRPFPRSEDLAEGIKQLHPDWEKIESLKSVVTMLSSPTVLPERKLVDNHPRKTFQQSMGVYVLPSLEDDELVKELLTTTTFKSALGSPWPKMDSGSWQRPRRPRPLSISCRPNTMQALSRSIGPRACGATRP